MRLPSLERDQFRLLNAERRHLESPDTFPIPDHSVRDGLTPGCLAKLMFEIDFEDEDGNHFQEVERMWVVVKRKVADTYLGWLTNEPYSVDASDDEHLVQWCEVPFRAEHIIDVMPPDPAMLAKVAPIRASRTWRN